MRTWLTSLLLLGVAIAFADAARAEGHWERQGAASYPGGLQVADPPDKVSGARRRIQGNTLVSEVWMTDIGQLRLDRPRREQVIRWTFQTSWADPPARLDAGQRFPIRCQHRLTSGNPSGGHGTVLSAFVRRAGEPDPGRSNDPRRPMFRFTAAPGRTSDTATLTLAAPPGGGSFEVVIEPYGSWGISLLPVVYRYAWVDDVKPLRYSVDFVDANPALYGGRMPEELGAAEIAGSPHVREGTVTDGVSRLIVRLKKSRDAPVQVEIVEGGGVLSTLPARRFQAQDGTAYGFLLYTPRDAFGGGARAERPRAVFDPAAQPAKRLEDVLEVEDLVLRLQPVEVGENGELTPQGEPSTTRCLLARPPVVLVHGLFSDPIECWVKSRESGQSFAAMLERAGLMPFLVNYQRSNGGSDQARPSTFASNARVVWDSPDAYDPVLYEWGWFKDTSQASWLGQAPVSEQSDFQRVHAIRIGGIRAALEHYREKLHLAATQADVVGHSMGGVLARVYAAQPDYRRPANYGAGDIHRLVTICTPHFGSELPELRGLITDATVEGESYGAWMRRSLTSLLCRAFLGPDESGALGDLRAPRPGMPGDAPALQAIGPTRVPSYAIATELDDHLLGQPGADLNRHYLHVFGALALMYFNNPPLLDAFVDARAEAWRRAGPLQRKTDRAGESPAAADGRVVDWSGPEGVDIFRRAIGDALDESVYYWDLARGPDRRTALEQEIQDASLAPAGWMDLALGEADAGAGGASFRDRAVLRLGSALVGGDIERLGDATSAQDVPLPVIGMIRGLVFHDDANDGTVRVVSQVGGIEAGATETFPGISHSLAPWSYPVIRRTIDLLKWEDARFARQGFPAAGQPMPCYLPSLRWFAEPVRGRAAVRWAGYVERHATLYGEVADRMDTIIIGRPVNRDSTRLLAEGAAAKGMAVKGKTSNWGPQRGLICLDQRYSKLWRVYATDPVRRDELIAKYSEKTRSNLTDTYPPDGGDARLVGRPFGVARALELPIRGKAVYAVLVDPREPDAEKAVYLRQKGTGAFYDWRNTKEHTGGYDWDNFDANAPLAAAPTPSPDVVARLEPMTVLADGLSDREVKPYLTADYDLLAIGFHRSDGFHGPPPEVENAPFHPLQGAISPRQMDLVRRLNEAVITRAGHPSGDVTHHGPENQYDGSPYVDYPLLVFDPGAPGDGVADVFLVRQGPVGYRDLHLKRYFADAFRRGYNLYPNGRSPVGWLWEAWRDFTRETGYDPRDAKELGPYVAEQPRPRPDEDPEAGVAEVGTVPEAVAGDAERIVAAIEDAAKLAGVLAEIAERGTLPGALDTLAREGYLGKLLQTLAGADEFRALMGMLDPSDLARTLRRWVAGGHHKQALKTLAEAGYLGRMFEDLAGTAFLDPVVEVLVGEGSLGSIFEALDKAGVVQTAEELVHALRRLAREGDARAMVALALRLGMDGEGPADAVAEAASWLEKAARRGSARATAELARYYLYGWARDEDPARAFELFRAAADGGDDVGLNGLGVLYNNGRGVAEDPVAARRLFERAVELGNLKALYNLAGIYRDGRGVKADAGRAFEYDKRAAERGMAAATLRVGACYERGIGVRQDEAEARVWYARSDAQGERAAAFRLGRMLYEGRGGAKDLTAAVRLIRRAAEAGQIDGQHYLGWFYYRGEGVPRSYELALEWFTRAAERSYAPSEYWLGLMHRDGEGVPANARRAVEHLRVAAEAGMPEAMADLGALFLRGAEGLPADEPEGARWVLAAAAGGNLVGRFNAGVVREFGMGTEKDLVDAYAWYSVAAAGGYEQAVERRDALEKSLSPEQLRRAQARAQELMKVE